MPRTVEIVTPSSRTELLLAELNQFPGVASLKVQHGVSLKPRGDVTTVQLTNRALPDFMRLLDSLGIGQESGTSIATSSPLSIVSPSDNSAIVDDSSEATWEEAEQTLVKESDATLNTLALMALAGTIATIGIATNAVHIVIGAMVIAPGFQPLLQIPLGIVARTGSWKRGLIMSAKLYAALLLGAAATALLLQGTTSGAFGSQITYLESYELISYWRSITVPSILASAAAGLAGALLVSTQRSILTSGVMIALALIPAASLIAIATATTDLSLLRDASLRWLIDVALVIAAGLIVFEWKRLRTHRRSILPHKHPDRTE